MATDAQALLLDMAVDAVPYEIEAFSGEKAPPHGESGIGGQPFFSGNTSSRQGSQPKAEESCQKRSCTIEDCYQALLRYRSSRINDDGTENHLTEKGGGRAAITLGENNQEVGRTQAASDLEHLDTNLHRRKPMGRSWNGSIRTKGSSFLRRKG